MPHWKNCRSDTLYYHTSAAVGHPCEVRIDDTSIVITYKAEDGWVTYKGSSDGSGHFHLRADRSNGEATLHRFPPDGSFLDGYWAEGSERGMWRIRLE